MKIIDNIPYVERFQAIDAAYDYLHKKVLVNKADSQTSIFLYLVSGFVAGMLFSLLYFFYFGIISLH